MEQLYTRWGKELNREHIWEEYPRPLMARDSYICLNGEWEYSFTKKAVRPEKYDGKILVPFSPESALSGVSRQLKPRQYLWYRKTFQIDKEELKEGKRLLLHFGAVDQICVVYINGREVRRHTGGYLPFSCDITDALKIPEEGGVLLPGAADEKVQEITVAVKDASDRSYHARGKQKLRRGGMFYTAQSGIWQTVWMEYVPKQYIKSLETEPDPDGKKVKIIVRTAKNLPVDIVVCKPGLYNGKMAEALSIYDAIADWGSGKGISNHAIEVDIPEVKLWTPETPYLYYFIVKMGEDTVKSYFALRTVTIEKDENSIPRICLNHRQIFLKGVLDQGYWPEGLYTAPSDEAFIFDIQSAKDMGFNMIRKHLKIEPQRWYYHCDRLGMMVWQDMVNGGGRYKKWFVTYVATLMSWRQRTMKDTHFRLLSRKSEDGQMEFTFETKQTVKILKNHPGIITWVIFNEGWGQFRTQSLTNIVRGEDPSRLIDSASGWFDQGCGDFVSIHNYFFKLKLQTEEKRAAVLSEFGGYTMRVEGHAACGKQYGYGKHSDRESLNTAYQKRNEEVQALTEAGLCGSIYTQLSDIEEEVNGIFTYDREIKKLD